jgi:hypothetical protein
LQTRMIFKPFLHGRFFHYGFIFLFFYFHFHLIVPFSTRLCYPMESGKTQTSPCCAKCFNILFLSFFNQKYIFESYQNQNIYKVEVKNYLRKYSLCSSLFIMQKNDVQVMKKNKNYYVNGITKSFI